MKKCQCDGNGWIRLPNTKSIIYCPDCQQSKVLKRKTVKSGTKVVSTEFGAGEVLEDSKKPTIKIRFFKMENKEQIVTTDRSEVFYMYDRD